MKLIEFPAELLLKALEGVSVQDILNVAEVGIQLALRFE